MVHYNRLLPFFSRDLVETPTDGLLSLDLEVYDPSRSISPVSHFEALSSLVAVSMIFKRKQRRREARQLIGDMNESIVRPMNDLSLIAEQQTNEFHSTAEESGGEDRRETIAVTRSLGLNVIEVSSAE
jgi:hypothetical protein